MSKAIFIEKITDLSVNKDNYEDEWFITDMKEEEFTCLCDKSNNTCYTFINKKNKNNINVCFTCIGKFMKSKKSDAVILCKQFTYLKTSKNPKRMCHSCHKHNINQIEESWRTICKNCWGEGKRDITSIPILGYKLCEVCFVLNVPSTSNNIKCNGCYKNELHNVTEDDLRECTICNLKKILKTDPVYKDKCSECFKLTKRNEELEEKRECSVCKEWLIPISKPDYIDKCNGCFRAANAEKRECSICKELKISINEPKFKDKCVDCFKLLANELRACSQCGNVSIPASKPSYVTKCTNCFKMKEKPIQKDDKMRECIQCHKFLIPSIAPSFKTKCNECLDIKNVSDKKKEEVHEGAIPDITIHMKNLNMVNAMKSKK